MKKRIIQTLWSARLSTESFLEISTKDPMRGILDLLVAEGLGYEEILKGWEDITLTLEDGEWSLSGSREETDEEYLNRSEKEVKELERLIASYPLDAAKIMQELHAV